MDRQREISRFPLRSRASTNVVMSYLDFLGFFSSALAFGLFCFCPIHPQPQLLFLSAIFITSFHVDRFVNVVGNNEITELSILAIT
jgi:hypothetical protein